MSLCNEPPTLIAITDELAVFGKKNRYAMYEILYCAATMDMKISSKIKNCSLGSS